MTNKDRPGDERPGSADASSSAPLDETVSATADGTDSPSGDAPGDAAGDPPGEATEEGHGLPTTFDAFALPDWVRAALAANPDAR